MISTSNTKADIELPSRLDSMLRVEAMIDDIGVTIGASEEVRANMQVAVGEAVKNAIEFGNQSDASKSVLLSVEKKEGEV
ncbi:MAG TPA: hypothetical protein DCQ93_09895, partial [Bacteroidetes bacterium]|nr:hypothetical protein [Bacteroidota bacterium]